MRNSNKLRVKQQRSACINDNPRLEVAFSRKGRGGRGNRSGKNTGDEEDAHQVLRPKGGEIKVPRHEQLWVKVLGGLPVQACGSTSECA